MALSSRPNSLISLPVSTYKGSDVFVNTAWALAFVDQDLSAEELRAKFKSVKTVPKASSLVSTAYLKTSTFAQRLAELDCEYLVDDRQLSASRASSPSSQTLPYFQARDAFLKWAASMPQLDLSDSLFEIAINLYKYEQWFTRDWTVKRSPGKHHRQNECLLVLRGTVSSSGGVGLLTCMENESLVDSAIKRPGIAMESGDIIISARYLVGESGKTDLNDSRVEAVKFMLHYIEVWMTMLQCKQVAAVFKSVGVDTELFAEAALKLITEPQSAIGNFSSISPCTPKMTAAVKEWSASYALRGKFNWTDEPVVVAPVVEPVAPIAEPITEPVVEPVAPIAEPITEPVVEPQVAPIVVPAKASKKRRSPPVEFVPIKRQTRSMTRANQ